MIRSARLLSAALFAAVLVAPLAPAQSSTRLVADTHRFLFDGKPLQIISGEMHYARIPREYWRDRLKKARAMGLNTISTYVFWNLHELKPGTYDFKGQNDVAEFVRIAGSEGLHVILRPGPYVCAEWDLGGYPAWLLADSAMVLRSTYAPYQRAVEKWLDRLGKELTPLLTSHGGPIMAVQVENEYGSFDKDKEYMAWQRGALKHAGFGGAMLYTADGDVQLPNGALPDLPAVVNFGTGDSDSSFARLARFRPAAPIMSGEYWAGWFDQWGRRHNTTNFFKQEAELAWMLDRGYSVNLYMFHGGTTFGFMNGANIDGGTYHPQTTSYDYDAALDESGRPTAKYHAFRAVIANRSDAPLPPVPESDTTIAIPPFTLTSAASLLANLPAGIKSDHPIGMEAAGQSYGYILYRTTLKGPAGGRLATHGIRDYAAVYVNGALNTTMDRRLKQDSVDFFSPLPGARLDILVENTGRVNFQKVLRGERKGMTGPVSINGVPLTDWEVVSLPMSTQPSPRVETEKPEGAAYYRGSFTLSRTGDTFLDMRGWGKGTVWVNGHHLGRFWQIGPQQTLYVPGPWLKKGRNEVVVFDLVTPAQRTLRGLTGPVLDEQH